MTLLHFNGNILQMGVVEMGWGSGALLGGLVLACKALKSKQTLVMHTAYVILGLYLISASYLPSSAFIGFVCLTFGRHSLFHLPCAFHRYYSAELGFGHAWTDFSLIFSLSTFPSMPGYRSFRILGGSMGYHIRLYDQRMGYLSDWSGCKFYFFNQAVG